MGMTLFTPSLPPRRKMKSSFFFPSTPSARARLRNGGMFIKEASPMSAVVWKPAFKNERRVMMLAIKKSFLLFLETREAHQQRDHAPHTAVIGGRGVA